MKVESLLKRIKIIRKKLKLSQSDMADKLHIALKTYQNIENGITKIDVERLNAIAKVLDTDIYHLLANEMEGSVLPILTEKEIKLYEKIIEDKEAYIYKLEEHLKFYQQLIKINNAI